MKSIKFGKKKAAEPSAAGVLPYPDNRHGFETVRGDDLAGAAKGADCAGSPRV